VTTNETAIATETVVTWVRSVSSIVPPESWVPGASESERSTLWPLGGLIAAHRLRVQGHLGWLSEIEEMRTWLSEAPAPPDQVVDAMVVIGNAGAEAVAAVYENLVAAVSRRRLGTFFTPATEARWMVERWNSLFGAPSSVVDVGAGVGMFTFLAHKIWHDSHLVPVDINPVTLGLFAVRPESQIDKFEERVAPQLADFTEWSRRAFSSLPGARLILGNPPYTRLQLIPRELRRTLLDATKGLCGSRASLSALLLGTSLTLLAPEDGLCLLLPAQWLESDYALGLRAWLWDERHRLVELQLFDARLFPDAQVDAVCLIVGPRRPSTQPFNAGSVKSTSRAADETMDIDRSGSVPNNWRGLFIRGEKSQVSEGLLLSQFASIRRGVATGSNSFFALSTDDVEKWGLPREFLHTYVRRTRDFAKSNAVTPKDLAALENDVKQFLLCVPADTLMPASVVDYLSNGMERSVDKSYLARTRRNWFDLSPEIFVPDLIVSAASRSTFAILDNEAKATITNNLYGLSWKRTTTAAQKISIANWLRTSAGQSAIWSASRTQAEGLRKIEVSAFAKTVLPANLTAVS
jgi:SAM-dependent methyltransferase